MAFDLTTAKLDQEPAKSGGFDLSTAKVSADPADGEYSSEEYQDPSIPLSTKQREAQAARAGKTRLERKQEASTWDKIKGAGEAALAVGSTMLAAPVGAVTGVYHGLTSGKLGTAQGVRDADAAGGRVADAMTYEPSSEKGKEYAGAIGEAFDNSKLAGMLPAAGELSAIGSLAKPAARQVSGPVGKVVGKALEPEIYMAKNLADKVKVPSILPKISEEKAVLAKKALDMGIEIPPHMLSDNNFVRIAGEFVDNLPLSGSTKGKNKEAFNKFLVGQIGGDEAVKALTPAVFAKAQRKAGRTIGDTFAQIAIPGDDATLVKGVEALKRGMGRELEPTNNLIMGNIEELTRLASENGGFIPGTAFKKLHSEVAAKLRSNLDAHPGMRERLNDFQNLLEDAADKQITDPAMKAAYQDARVKYAKSKTLEPLVAKNDVTGVAPQALLGRMNATTEGKHRMATESAGELGDAAAVAQNFMREETHQNAAGRGFVLGAATGLADAGKAALGAVAGNVYNRFGPVISRRIIKNSLPAEKSAAAKPALGLVEKGAEDTGSPFPPKEYPQRGLLSLQPKEAAALPKSGVPDTERLATRHDHPTIDFPLRQEVLQQPEIQAATDAFRTEAVILQRKIDKAINPKVVEKAKRDMERLQQDFADGMRQLGIGNAAEAHGLNRPLYEVGGKTKLPIKKTYSMKDGAP